MPQRATKAEIERAARFVAQSMSGHETPKVTVQHGNWTGYAAATYITFTWSDGHKEMLAITGTKSEVYARLCTAVTVLSIQADNQMREG